MSDSDDLKTSDIMGILKRFLKSDKVCERFLLAQETAVGKININGLLKTLGFSDVAVDSYKNTISDWLDKDGSLNDAFYTEYNKLIDELKKDRERYKTMKKDAAVLDAIPVHRSFDLKNTFECLADNEDIRYYIPEGYKLGELNYENQHLQLVKLICVSESLPVPFTYIHYFKCSKCDEEIKTLSDKEKPRCRCGTVMKRDDRAAKSMTVYVSKVIYEGNQIDAISRTKLPMNQFDAAVIPVKNEDKYNLFILAVGLPVPKEMPLVWTGGDRMVDLIKNIDKMHTERIGKSVRGLDHVKMAILMTRMAGLMGNTATQTLIVGSPGCGKSTVTKFYAFTLTDKSAFRDATTVTHAGLLGSSEVIDVFGSRSPVMQLGLLERYEMSVLDEFLDKSNEDLNVLKNALSSTTITSEKHNNKREVSRMSTILAPSNVPDAHMKAIKYLSTNKMGADFDDRTFNLRAMPPQLKDEFASSNKSWRDGEPLAILDRFAFIFYVESSRKGIGVIDEIVKSPEDRIPDTALRSLLYTKTVDDYLKECIKIKFEYSDDFDRPNLDRLIKKYCLPKGSFSEGFGDDTHSLERINKYFRMMIECHSLINMRNRSNEDDYTWLDKFYAKLCNFVYTDDLFWEDNKRTDSIIRTDDDQQKRGAIRFHILDYLGQCGKAGAKRDVIISSCSLSGLSTELAISMLSEMVGDNVIIFDPPDIYKVLSDK